MRVTTPQDVKDFFEELIDDTIGETFFYQLLNKANDALIAERDWEAFKAIDTSKSTAVGDTYLSTKALPVDFYTPRRKIYVGTLEHLPIPFEKRIVYKDTPRLYYIDHANNVFGICGTQSMAQVISFPYNPIPTEITSADSASTTIIKWPTLFRTVLAFKMAELIEAGVDADSISVRMSAQQRGEYRELKRQIEDWDARLKLHAMDYSASSIDDSIDTDGTDPNLGLY